MMTPEAYIRRLSPTSVGKVTHKLLWTAYINAELLREPAMAILAICQVFEGQGGLLEWVAKTAGVSLNMGTFETQINTLSERGIIERSVISDLHWIRIRGNKARHKTRGRELTANDAMIALVMALDAVVWLHTEWVKGPQLARGTVLGGQDVLNSEPIPTVLGPHEIRCLGGPAARLTPGNDPYELAGVPENVAFPAHTVQIPDLVREQSDYLRQILAAEISRRLRSTNIFSSRAINKSISEVESDYSFARVAGRSLVNEMLSLDASVAPPHDLGMIEDLPAIRAAFGRHGGLSIAIAPAQVGAAALVTYMQRCMYLPVNPQYQYQHSPQIASRIVHGKFTLPPHACVLGSAATASIIATPSSTGYIPVFLMPRISHRLVAPPGTDPGNFDGQYITISDTPSTTRFYYEKLVRLGRVPYGSEPMHLEPHETTAMLSQSNQLIRAAMWFPCYEFNRRWNRSVVLGDDDDASGEQATFLFVREDVAEDDELILALNTAIRHAWINLQLSQATVFAIVDLLLANPTYTSVLCRVSGVQYFPPFEGTE